ncbi:MAG: YggS family pyridoxal phosphate-dependent enzyme [Candidatus Diapherotrites archaeon]|nr:YggS family pyridoxal phosphate-dependent enzyme [Candidatus Diapherotrites archaeon]
MIEKNYFRVKEIIKEKNPDCRLVIITKNRSIDEIEKLIRIGHRDFGENRVQELESKVSILNEKYNDLIWHFVGHLQSNKVKRVVKTCEYIHSLDSTKTADKIEKSCQQFNKKVKCFIEINIAKDPKKHGIFLEDLEHFYLELKNKQYKNLEIIGLMTIAPFVKAEDTRIFFKELKNAANKINLNELSMGMSNDYIIALEEGATFVRIGRKIFE